MTLRPVDAIRADLEHPHTAALTALHSTIVGDGPIGRLLRDVGPLLAERERVLTSGEHTRLTTPWRQASDLARRLRSEWGMSADDVAEFLAAAVRSALAASPTPTDPETCQDKGRDLVAQRSYFCARPLGHSGLHSVDATPGPSSIRWLEGPETP